MAMPFRQYPRARGDHGRIIGVRIESRLAQVSFKMEVNIAASTTWVLKKGERAKGKCDRREYAINLDCSAEEGWISSKSLFTLRRIAYLPNIGTSSNSYFIYLISSAH